MGFLATITILPNYKLAIVQNKNACIKSYMNEDTIADLKQFIVTRAYRTSVVRIIEKSGSRLEKNLEKKMDDIASDTGQAIDDLSEHVEKQTDTITKF